MMRVQEAFDLETTILAIRKAQDRLRAAYVEFHVHASKLATVATEIQSIEHKLKEDQATFIAWGCGSRFPDAPLQELAARTGKSIGTPLKRLHIENYWPPSPDGCPLAELDRSPVRDTSQ